MLAALRETVAVREPLFPAAAGASWRPARLPSQPREPGP